MRLENWKKRLWSCAFALTLPSACFTQVSIHWDQSTAQRVTAGGYSRLVLLNTGELALVYSAGSDLWIRKSSNQGAAWGNAVQVASLANYDLTNASMIQLQNGWLLYAYNGRPQTSGLAYTIGVCVSKDEGASWSTPVTIYSAGTTSGSGCWEPQAIQMPWGEIQLFFSNEAPYPPPSSDQEIDLFRSFDNGATWQGYTQVSYAAGARDGMPVPVFLAENKGIAYSIESNPGTSLQPYIIWSSLADNWYQGPSLLGSPRRWAVDPSLPSGTYSGAPFLIQVSSGDTLVSCQSDVGRTPGYENTRVYVGDSRAQNFSSPTTPWPSLPANAAALWNAMCVLNSSTILVSSTMSGSQTGIYTILGHLQGITPPAAPAGLKASVSLGLSLSWNPVDGATGYNVKRGISTGGPYSTIAFGVSATSLTDSSAIPGVPYDYVVTALNPDEGPVSNEVTATLPLQPLPCPWSDGDVGAPTTAGSAIDCGGTFTVAGAGADINGTFDHFHYVSQPLSGDATLSALIPRMGNTYIWAKAGLMFRDSTGGGAANAYLAVTPDNGVTFQWRAVDGGSTASATLAGVACPVWLRLSRTGNTFSAEYSTDDATWNGVGTSQTLSFAGAATGGLAVTSHCPDLLNAAVFQQVVVAGGALCSPTPSMTRTASPTPSVSSSPSPSPTPTTTSGITGTCTATPTETASPDPSPTVTPSPHQTITPTTTVPGTAGPTPIEDAGSPSFSSGPPILLKVVPVPNPQSGPTVRFAVDLSDVANLMDFKLFNAGYILVDHRTIPGNWSNGWGIFEIELARLPEGIYFVVLRPSGQGRQGSPAKPVPLMLIH